MASPPALALALLVGLPREAPRGLANPPRLPTPHTHDLGVDGGAYAIVHLPVKLGQRISCVTHHEGALEASVAFEEVAHGRKKALALTFVGACVLQVAYSSRLDNVPNDEALDRLVLGNEGSARLAENSLHLRSQSEPMSPLATPPPKGKMAGIRSHGRELREACSFHCFSVS